MANSLEKFFLGKVKQMPPVEVVMTPDQLRKPSNKKPQAIRGKRVLPSGSASAVNASTTPMSSANSNSSPPSPDLIINNVNDKKLPDLGSLQAGVFSQALFNSCLASMRSFFTKRSILSLCP